MTTPHVSDSYIDGCVLRRARRAWPCQGDGRRSALRQHAETCPREISPGHRYVEYVGEVAAFQSGSRHTVACADAFLRPTPEGQP